MNYEGTISPETMANFLAYWRAKANHAALEAEANRAQGHPRTAQKWDSVQAANLAIVDLLERAVHAEHECITPEDQ